MDAAIEPAAYDASLTSVKAPRSRYWLLCADAIPALIAACIPWSTTAVSVLWPVWLISLIPNIERKSIFRVLRYPASWLPIAFFALALIGVLWADGPWHDRLQGLSPVVKLLIIPLLLYHFSRSKRAGWVLRAFVLSCAVLDVLSWIVIFEPQWRMTHADVTVTGVPIKNSIDQSHELALCMFAMAGVALRFFDDGRVKAFALLTSFIAALFATIVFVATSRTALFCIPILAMLFCARHLSIKAAIGVFAVCVVVALAAWFTSPYLRRRVENVGSEYLNYRDANLPTSTGMRLAWWKESLRFVADAPSIGHGTGSTKQLLNKGGTERLGLWSGLIRNPHNQTLYVAIEWGLIGCIILYAMWLCHMMLFRGNGLASWIGLVVVTQNILSSIFNSHLFDFTEGWIYVLGVGVAGGIVLKSRMGGPKEPPLLRPRGSWPMDDRMLVVKFEPGGTPLIDLLDPPDYTLALWVPDKPTTVTAGLPKGSEHMTLVVYDHLNRYLATLLRGEMAKFRFGRRWWSFWQAPRWRRL